jgi:hypothetical protein
MLAIALVTAVLAVGAVAGAVGCALWPRAGRYLLSSSRIWRE